MKTHDLKLRREHLTMSYSGQLIGNLQENLQIFMLNPTKQHIAQITGAIWSDFVKSLCGEALKVVFHSLQTIFHQTDLLVVCCTSCSFMKK